jgi:hypothetical protein
LLEFAGRARDRLGYRAAMNRAAVIAALVLASMLGGCAKAVTFGSKGSENGAPRLQYGVELPMWDHYCVGIEGGTEAGRGELLDRALRQASARGWELVAVDGGLLCFKRPRPSKS